MPTALDTTTNTTPILASFRAQGGTHICRYIASGGAYKLLRKPEADAIHVAGLSLLLNFEGRGNDINAFSHDMGIHDANLSLTCARDELKAPIGTAIYFSCEPENLRNLNSDYVNCVLPYFRACRTVLGSTYRLGAYAFGTYLDWLLRDKAIDFCWLPGASGWAGYQAFLASGRWAIRQIPGQLEKTFHGIQVDWDEVNPAFADIGAWGSNVETPLTQPLPTMPTKAYATIRRGNAGPDVRYLQQKLGITADGIFGALTDHAVRQFQTIHGLVPDGIVGPLTWANVEGKA